MIYYLIKCICLHNCLKPLKGVYTPRAQASASVLAQSGSLNVLFASHFVLDDASTLALACSRGVYTTKC